MKLLEPFSLKSIPLRNRILRSATWEALADHEGYLSPEQYRVYQELAENHVGLICTGYARVDSTDRPNAGMMGIYDDLFIPQYQKLTELIRRHGAKASGRFFRWAHPARRRLFLRVREGDRRRRADSCFRNRRILRPAADGNHAQ